MLSLPPEIKSYQPYHYKPIDQIPEGDFELVKRKLENLQSNDPLVSLVFIAYNEEDYIFGTLSSLANLKSKYPLEIIVVNNNSTDNTQRILDKCGIDSIFESQQGYAFARQAGFHRARGKYVISGDTDTLYPSTWVDPLIEPMERDQSVVGTYSLYSLYRDDNNYSLGMYLYDRARLIDIHLKDFKRPHLNVRGFSMAFRKDIAEQIGGYNTEVKRGSDGYLGIELSDYGKLKMVKSNKSKVYTNMRRTEMQGGLFQSFVNRFFMTFRYFFHMFTKQKDR